MLKKICYAENKFCKIAFMTLIRAMMVGQKDLEQLAEIFA